MVPSGPQRTGPAREARAWVLPQPRGNAASARRTEPVALPPPRAYRRTPHQLTSCPRHVRSPRSARGGSLTRRTTLYGRLPTPRNSILRPLLTAGACAPPTPTPPPPPSSPPPPRAHTHPP